MPLRRALGSHHQGRVLGCAIKACARDTSSDFCHQGWCGFLKQVKGESTSLLVQILFKTFVASRAAGARGSGSVGASRVGQVSVHSVPSKVGSWFVSCSAGRSGLGSLRAHGRSGRSVGRWGGSTMPASGRAHYRWSYRRQDVRL